MAQQPPGEEAEAMTSEANNREGEVTADNSVGMDADTQESTTDQADNILDTAEKYSSEQDALKQSEDKIEPSSVEEEIPDSTQHSDTGDHNLPKAPPVEAETIASDSEAQQTSAQSNSEVDSTAQTTDQSKSEKPEIEGQNSVPATSDTVTGDTEDIKRPATEPAYIKKVLQISS